MLKDHLGNVRMVLTEDVKPNYYPAATLEGTYNATGITQTKSMINFEKGFYNIDNSKVVLETAIPSWPTETAANTKLYYNNNGNPPTNGNYPSGTTPAQTDGSTKLYQLNATTNKTGLEFVIKVMAGDKIDIFGSSYYLNTTNITNTNSTPLDLLSLMTNMLLSPANPAVGKGFTGAQLNDMNTVLVPSTFFRGANNEATTTVPKAYINYLLFDEQFKCVGGNFSRVGASGSVKKHYSDPQLQGIPVTKNGYIFVYISNESNLNVFFDNLQVIHKPGPIVEETHYYPFGLTMAGISYKTIVKPENKFGITSKEKQDKEFSDGSGLEMYDYGARMYDAQIGRWHVVDPMADSTRNSTPYEYAYNAPIKFIDPDGRDVIVANEKDREKILYLINSISKTTYNFDSKGKLFATDKINEKGSAKYSTQINEAIGLKKTINIQLDTTFQDNKGNAKFVDADAGGGVTLTLGKRAPGPAIDQRDRVARDPTIIISGNPNFFLPDKVEDGAELILMHEVVGHALPIIRGKLNGNAVDNENVIRDDLKKPLRKSEPEHKESKFGGN